eukprot:2076576-Karenia_brevis.AAC.1
MAHSGTRGGAPRQVCPGGLVAFEEGIKRRCATAVGACCFQHIVQVIGNLRRHDHAIGSNVGDVANL